MSMFDKLIADSINKDRQKMIVFYPNKRNIFLIWY